MMINRGDLYYANLGDVNSTSVQNGIRPVLVISMIKGINIVRLLLLLP